MDRRGIGNWNQDPERGTASYRTEEPVRREDARMLALQDQLDELRMALREIASRQVRIEEIIKVSETSVVQNRTLVEQIRQEIIAASQARQQDEQRLRQTLVDFDQRLDDGLRPVRALQAHVTELVENTQRASEDAATSNREFDALRALIDQVQAHSDRNYQTGQQLRDALEVMREELANREKEDMRIADSVGIVEQELRRRMADVAAKDEEVANRFTESRADMSHAIGQIEAAQRALAELDPAIEQVRTETAGLRSEGALLRESLATNHEAALARVEEVRLAAEAALAEVRQAAETRDGSADERLADLSDGARELGLRISAIAHQLEELRQADSTIRRELWQLQEQRARLRLEQAQAELEQVTGQRRVSEAGDPRLPDFGSVERPVDR